MHRINGFIVVLLTVVLLVFSGGVTGNSQTATGTKLITVTAQTVASVPLGKNYLADISRDTVMYEFDPTRAPIDFKRVSVRTATEQMPIEPWIQARFADRLTGWQTDILTIGTVAAFRNASDPFPPPPIDSPPSTEIIVCDGNYCTCEGLSDCRDLVHSGLCWTLVGCTHRGSGVVRCLCDRRQT